MFQMMVECIGDFGMRRHPCRHGGSHAPEIFHPAGEMRNPRSLFPLHEIA
jgi:hypothetical protein